MGATKVRLKQRRRRPVADEALLTAAEARCDTADSSDIVGKRKKAKKRRLVARTADVAADSGDGQEAGRDAAVAKTRNRKRLRVDSDKRDSESSDGSADDGGTASECFHSQESGAPQGHDVADADEVPEPQPEPVDRSGALARLRALLTPAGFGQSAADEAAAAAAEAVAAAAAEVEPEETSGATRNDGSQAPGEGADEKSCPAVQEIDWTTRYHVVNATDSAVPFDQLAWPIHPSIEVSLRKGGYDVLFPIQAAVIPLLARAAETAYDCDSPYSCDVCVAAPTGQGLLCTCG